MLIEVSDEQRAELRTLLVSSLGDLSSEIAGTDNPEYRQGLRQHRSVLESVLVQLENAPHAAD